MNTKQSKKKHNPELKAKLENFRKQDHSLTEKKKGRRPDNSNPDGHDQSQASQKMLSSRLLIGLRRGIFSSLPHTTTFI